MTTARTLSKGAWLRFSLVFSVLALAPLLQAVHASLFPNRYAIAPVCSLMMELEQNCQVKSRMGKNVTGNSYKGLYMYFGETNCTVDIKQCYPGSCYSFRDLTAQLPTDYTILSGTGFFKQFQIVSGGEGVSMTKEGVAFRATSDTVRVVYSTVTCQEFYRWHGRVPYQLCNQPLEAITPIDTRYPNALGCA